MDGWYETLGSYNLSLLKRTPHPHGLSPSYKCTTYQKLNHIITQAAVGAKQPNFHII